MESSSSSNSTSNIAQEAEVKPSTSSDEIMFGNISAAQMTALAKIFQTLNRKPDVNEADLVKQLLSIAPRFDMKQIDRSLKEFEVFFQVNDVQNFEVKFKVLQARLPWDTMYQFGLRYPDCASSLSDLVAFLKTYASPSSPSLEMLNNFNKFNNSCNFKDLHHASVMGAKLNEDEQTKLLTYAFASEDMKPLVKSYMSLPLSRFVEKMVKKWNEKDPYVSSYQTSPTFIPPPRPLYNQTPMPSSNQPPRSSLAISHSSQSQRPFFHQTRPVLNQNRPSNSKNRGSSRTFYSSYPRQQIDRASPTVSDLCRVHQRHGDSAWSCEGHPCKMAHLFFAPHQAQALYDDQHKPNSVRKSTESNNNRMGNNSNQKPSTPNPEALNF